ncbi:MAG: HAD-IA family hydrolase [Planctomycetes bacterium]|nr:HAD-IA family hydrolase [Planctomycetota bacterium]
MPRVPRGARAAAFDAVGTLLFPNPPAPVAYADTARRFGLDLAPDAVRARFVAAYRREEAADAATDWATSEPRERARWHTIVTETLAGVSDPEACYQHLFDHFAQPGAWELAPGAADVLSALAARGLVLALGSNYDERLWSVLAGFPELDPLKDRVLISAAVGVRKPGAGFFAAVARAVGCAPSEVLFVGDDIENDYAGATAAGMPALLLDPDTRHPEVPHRIAALSELLD